MEKLLVFGLSWNFAVICVSEKCVLPQACPTAFLCILQMASYWSFIPHLFFSVCAAEESTFHIYFKKKKIRTGNTYWNIFFCGEPVIRRWYSTSYPTEEEKFKCFLCSSDTCDDAQTSGIQDSALFVVFWHGFWGLWEVFMCSRWSY